LVSNPNSHIYHYQYNNYHSYLNPNDDKDFNLDLYTNYDFLHNYHENLFSNPNIHRNHYLYKDCHLYRNPNRDFLPYYDKDFHLYHNPNRNFLPHCHSYLDHNPYPYLNRDPYPNLSKKTI
jgi:hypothetical protein